MRLLRYARNDDNKSARNDKYFVISILRIYNFGMKLTPECYPCLSGLIESASEMATNNEIDRKRVLDAAMAVLARDFSPDKVSIVVATELHKVIKEISGVTDPYNQKKRREIMLAKELLNSVNYLYKNNFEDALKLAVLGNSMDFFKAIDSIDKAELKNKVEFAIDDSHILLEKLPKARRVLYLADNAGESFFDLPLLKLMRQYTSVAYVVKGSPVQNDITREDLKLAGLLEEFGEIIDTGMAAPGIILSLASPKFLHEFESADLIFAKGMGHYEALSELPPAERYFCCLKAKCQPVATSIGIPINGYVAMLL